MWIQIKDRRIQKKHPWRKYAWKQTVWWSDCYWSDCLWKDWIKMDCLRSYYWRDCLRWWRTFGTFPILKIISKIHLGKPMSYFGLWWAYIMIWWTILTYLIQFYCQIYNLQSIRQLVQTWIATIAVCMTKWRKFYPFCSTTISRSATPMVGRVC